MKLSLQKLFLYSLLALIAVSALYKYSEWQSLKSLSNLYNDAWTQEFTSVEKGSALNSKFSGITKKVFDKNSTSQMYLDSYSDLSGTFNLISSNEEDYSNLINNNNNRYKNLPVFFLLGDRGNFIKKLSSLQQQYYSYEISNSEINNAEWWLDFNILRAIRDMDLITEFNKNTSSDIKTTASKYFYTLSPLSDYEDNNFKWDHEEEIKKYFPNGFSTLTNYKNYLSDFYSMVKDFVAGDYQSASYKFSALKESSVDLNPDFGSLFKEENGKYTENDKNIIKIVSEEAKLIKDFNSKKLYKYPLLPDVKSWKEDLVLCQMYDFKSGLYYLNSNNYVSSGTPTDLLRELSTISPDTQMVDKLFDIKIMKISNDDKQIDFYCLDKLGDHNYHFIITK
ncbi:MAG TPA: hypothetical protein VFA93_00190 [Patescibacteria group bacterium]|nr:hypothetical protein [Patescibacteria group bacterium]